jgi:hypothetical protein
VVSINYATDNLDEGESRLGLQYQKQQGLRVNGHCLLISFILFDSSLIVHQLLPEQSDEETPGPANMCGRSDCCKLQNGDAEATKKHPWFPRFILKPYQPNLSIYPPSLAKHELKPLKSYPQNLML